MRYYPLFLDLSRIRCLVLGGGLVARRKVATLQKAGASSILVFDAFLSESNFFSLYEKEFSALSQKLSSGLSVTKIIFHERAFVENDLDNVRLAFAATSNHEQNAILAKLCEKQNIFCNVVEGVTRGDCIVPAHLDFDNLIIALSTSGASPALAKVLKADLQAWFDTTGYDVFLRLMEEIRLILLEEFSETEKRSEIFRVLVQKDFRENLLTLLSDKNKTELSRVLENVISKNICEKLSWEAIL